MASSLMLSILFFLSCAERPEQKIHASAQEKTNEPIGAVATKDYSGTELLADTIIYAVVIKNHNPEDDWAEECLQYFESRKFADMIFAKIYSGELQAKDFSTNMPLSIAEVKEMEANERYSRDKIGQIQFKERWYFNATTNEFNKEVLSITIGYQAFTENGELRGYRGGILIELPQNQRLAAR